MLKLKKRGQLVESAIVKWIFYLVLAVVIIMVIWLVARRTEMNIGFLRTLFRFK